MNEELIVTTRTASYPVVIGADLFDGLPDRLKALELKGSIWLVSDSNVVAHYGPSVAQCLVDAGYQVHTYAVPAGESSKAQEQLWRLYTWMIEGQIERADLVLALGGGVVGDLAGFAAATILRGVAVVQLPTTLLAMVDAAIGGKTGINHPLGKNLIGAFHQPRLVLANTTTLASLPHRERQAGWAEVIKHAVIRDVLLLEQLEQYADQLSAPINPESSLVERLPFISATIRQAAAVKVAIVSDDEREQGQRLFLNYGHTLGHALETATGYERLLHGEAVAIGMHAEARIASLMGLLDPSFVQRQQQLLTAYGLPTALPTDVEHNQLLELIWHDKKRQHNRIRWVLPTAPGCVMVHDDVPETIVRTALACS